MTLSLAGDWRYATEDNPDFARPDFKDRTWESMRIPQNWFLAGLDHHGVVWFRHDPAAFKQGVKGFADGSEGWLAHVDGDLLFVKVFADVPRQAQAPKEAEIEIYVDGAGRFVEVEQQGAYAELAPGASSSWPVRWLLRKLPAGMPVAPGSAELLSWVRTIVAELG